MIKTWQTCKVGLTVASLTCIAAASAVSASEPGSGIYATDCATQGGQYRINIRSDGQGEVSFAGTTFLDLLTSYSYYGDSTPPEFLVAVLFDRDTSPFPPGPDGDPRIEIWNGADAHVARLNGDASQVLRFCGALDTPGAAPDMPYSTEQYDAVGYLRCGLGETDLQLACPFGVYRGDPGSASVTLTTPADRERILNFDGGTVSDASQAPVAATRADGTWTLGIGDERYEIPDAVVDGG